MMWLLILAGAASPGGRPSGGATAGDLLALRGPPPPAEAMQAQMEAWHGEVEAAMYSLKREWRATLLALDRVLWSSAAPACERLSRSLERLERSKVLPVPDPVVSLYVGKMILELHRAVVACAADRYFETRYRMEVAGSHLLQIVRWFEPYGLRP